MLGIGAVPAAARLRAATNLVDALVARGLTAAICGQECQEDTCGTRNLQLRSSGDVVFIHIEASKAVREGDSALLDALAAVFPKQRAIWRPCIPGAGGGACSIGKVWWVIEDLGNVAISDQKISVACRGISGFTYNDHRVGFRALAEAIGATIPDTRSDASADAIAATLRRNCTRSRPIYP